MYQITNKLLYYILFLRNNIPFYIVLLKICIIKLKFIHCCSRSFLNYPNEVQKTVKRKCNNNRKVIKREYYGIMLEYVTFLGVSNVQNDHRNWLLR
jgi:hypothetical protein